jgi:rRNA-processing protein FCF1
MQKLIKQARSECGSFDPFYTTYQQRAQRKYKHDYEKISSIKPKIILDSNIFIRNTSKINKIIHELKNEFTILIPELVIRELKKFNKLPNDLIENTIKLSDHPDYYTIADDNNIKLHASDKIILSTAIKENASIVSFDSSLCNAASLYNVKTYSPFNIKNKYRKKLN